MDAQPTTCFVFRRANWLPHEWTACLLESRDLVPTHGSRILLISADAADELQRNRSARISPHQPNPRPMGWGMSATLQLVRHALLSNAYLFAKTLGTPSEASRASVLHEIRRTDGRGAKQVLRPLRGHQDDSINSTSSPSSKSAACGCACPSPSRSHCTVPEQPAAVRVRRDLSAGSQ